MNLIFSIYSRNAFRECILPSLNNTDHAITLRKDEFQLRQDIILSLEVIAGKWKIRNTSAYRVVEGDRPYQERELRDRQVLKIRTTNGETLTAIVVERKQSFHDFTKFSLSGKKQISIGRDDANDIKYDFMGTVSRKHALIEIDAPHAYITSLSPNGIYVNGKNVKSRTKLEFGDYINIVGLHMVFLGDQLAVDTDNKNIAIQDSGLTVSDGEDEKTSLMRMPGSGSTGKTIYHRAPRTIDAISSDPIEIEAPPQLQKQKKQSLLMMIGPSITMALPMVLGCLLMVYAYSGSGFMQGRQSLFMYSGLVMAVSSALVGTIWAVANMRNQQKEEAETAEKRIQRYGDYLIEKTEEIRERYDDTLRIMTEQYPDSQDCLAYDGSGSMLWSRNRTHEDFLIHRIGLGEVDFPTEIKIPQKRFTMEDDPLAEKAEFIRDNYKTLYDAPVTVDLSHHRLIGIIGGEGKKGAVDVARSLCLQIAAGNCYTDVKLGFIYSGESTADHDQWTFAKWLPHVWSDDKKTRFVASDKSNASEVFYELTTIFRDRSDKKNETGSNKEIPQPYYVVFISDPSMLEGELFAKYAYAKDPSSGLTTILLADSYEQLPNNCDYIIENNESFKGGYGVYGSNETRRSIIFDTVSSSDLEKFARKIAPLRVIEMEEGGDLPNALTFFEMLHIHKPQELTVRENWAKNRTYDSIRGQLGEKVGGTPCYLDVHEKYHGPHGLVAGTTGSGKSETLQTYMLSLAINYSPDDIGFFIIDYKGGGMANLFEGLPHMVGQISNLSGNQVRRAMISIKSENRRRQRIFNENGVNNINNYTRLFKNGEAALPVPHLFIVIDEFAELKREEPDFMRELISVAQVGRSLGVHLILATQKPSGTVDDNIWSNSRFKLCLRVQDRQDSMDMLHKPDAAYITQAGRCYLQVGNDEVYELFQSGYSGAAYDENIDIGASDIAKMISSSGKVEMTGNTLKQRQKKAVELAWVGKLLDALIETVKEMHITPKDAAGDAVKMQQLCRGIYTSLRKAEIDYPENRYNSDRLQDLTELCSKVNGTVKRDDLAKMIVDLAAETNTRLPQAKEMTELDAVKDHLAAVADENGYTHRHLLWLPVLKEQIYLDEFDEFVQNRFSDNWGWNKSGSDVDLRFVLGQWDDPASQSQPPFIMDLAEDGNIAVCGSVVSGKSTTLQTIAYSLINCYSPEAVNIYALDFSSKMMSAFEEAPHVGGVMFENDLDKIGKFFNMMLSILNDRKTIMRGGNFKQYVQVHGQSIPAIVIMIDNYASFKEKTGEQFESAMVQLSKEGINHGIFLVVSGGGFGMNDISTRVGENINTVITLALNDKFEYGDLLHTMQIDMLPETGIRGRGLALCGKRVLEYQTALAVKAENDYQRMEKIRAKCIKMSDIWTGRKARRVPEIPAKPEWSGFSELEEYITLRDSGRYLPVGYNSDNAAVYGIPLAKTYCYGVYGSRMTGKTNFLKICLLAALDSKASVCIIDSPEEKLAKYKEAGDTIYCDDEQSLFDFFGKLLPIIQERNARKKQLQEAGFEDEELFEQMSQNTTPIYIVISDLSRFVQLVYDSELDMRGFLENIIGKGQLLNIYFIASMSVENRAAVAGYPLFDLFTGYKTGIHFGGKTADDPLLNFDYLNYSEQQRSLKPGIGLLPDKQSPDAPWRIVVPLARSRVRDTDRGE